MAPTSSSRRKNSHIDSSWLSTLKNQLWNFYKHCRASIGRDMLLLRLPPSVQRMALDASSQLTRLLRFRPPKMVGPEDVCLAVAVIPIAPLFLYSNTGIIAAEIYISFLSPLAFSFRGPEPDKHTPPLHHCLTYFILLSLLNIMEPVISLRGFSIYVPIKCVGCYYMAPGKECMSNFYRYVVRPFILAPLFSGDDESDEKSIPSTGNTDSGDAFLPRVVTAPPAKTQDDSGIPPEKTRIATLEAAETKEVVVTLPEMTEEVAKEVTKEVTKAVTKEDAKEVDEEVTKEVDEEVTKEVDEEADENCDDDDDDVATEFSYEDLGDALDVFPPSIVHVEDVVLSKLSNTVTEPRLELGIISSPNDDIIAQLPLATSSQEDEPVTVKTPVGLPEGQGSFKWKGLVASLSFDSNGAVQEKGQCVRMVAYDGDKVLIGATSVRLDALKEGRFQVSKGDLLLPHETDCAGKLTCSIKINA